MNLPSSRSETDEFLILQNKDICSFVAASSGSGKGDFEKLSKILNAVPDVKFVCLDVANGYSEHFVEFVRSVREAFPQHVIMVRLLLVWKKKCKSNEVNML